ncbi:MAG: energy-dependent translational throttle protein EttA, partial [Deltaproteobacteria bacterium HGW-Deltaproteobacteria-22]
GVDKAFDGEAFPAKGVRIGYVPQEPTLDATKNVRGNVEAAFGRIQSLIADYNAVSERLGEELSPEAMEKELERMQKLQEAIDAVDGWNLERQVDLACDALVLPPDEMDVTKLSGGERRRVALCRALLEKPDVLLLDEPTNHLDAETVAWLEAHLQRYEGTVIAVTHDRFFLDNVAGWILELHKGEGIPWKGNYSSWLEQKQEKLKHGKSQDSVFVQTLQRELEWHHMSAASQHEHSKSRIVMYDSLMGADCAQKLNEMEIFIPPGPRLGKSVIEARGVRKSYGDRVLFENLDFTLPPGGIVGVIGPNGAGKTTLFRLITGQEPPDEGTFRIGETVKLAYVDQNRDSLDPEATIYEAISGGADTIPLGNREVNARAYCSRFNFAGQDQQKLLRLCSGGERNRVHLANMLKEGANVLLLDEPTNDLDINTLRALEEALEQFAGCVVVITHDRWFLDRVATHILAFEGESKVSWFDGNYTEYERDRKKRLGNAALVPKRIKYRQLTR